MKKYISKFEVIAIILIITMSISAVTTWDVSTPAGSDDPREADDRMREIKTAAQEVIATDHYMPNSSGTLYDDADRGEHVKVTLRVGDAPTVEADKGYLYAKDVDDKAELHYIDEDDNETQLTSAGALVIDANSINQDAIRLDNDEWLRARDNAGTGDVYLIKADVNDVPEILVGAVLSADTAPTLDNGIANKKYVDDQVGAVSAYNADGTTVFATATLGTDNTFQDLDLTTQVGANVALCFFKVTASNAGDTYAMKPKSDATTFASMKASATNACGSATAYFGSGTTQVAFLTCATDATGYVQHAMTTVSGVNITVVLVGYVK